MTKTPHISVLLPTRHRPDALRTCLNLLCRQSIPSAHFEVIVVFDGPDPQGSAAAAEFHGRLNLICIDSPRLGNAHTKNLALERASAPVVLFINDDVVPASDFLERHIAANAERAAGQPALILGHSPFSLPPSDDPRPDSIFDLLLRDTSMIFFYDRMIDPTGQVLAPRDHDWGYRHAWSLNLSVPREAALAVGGFRPAIANCCYEDVEFAFRVTRELGAPVLFRPEALAPHNHRLTPEDYLAREWRLGYSALTFAHAAPDCALDLFGRDLREGGEATYARSFVEREARQESPQIQAFQALAATSRSALSPESQRLLLPALYGQHLLLKRLAFRRGLLSAIAGEPFEGLFHVSAGLPTEPPLRALSTV